MTYKVVDIVPKLVDYLTSESAVNALAGTRIYGGGFPVSKPSGGEVGDPALASLAFKQSGGDPRGADYRFSFYARAGSLKAARALAITVVNALTEENFQLLDDDGNSLSHWAELEGSFVDGHTEESQTPEVYFSVNFYSQ